MSEQTAAASSDHYPNTTQDAVFPTEAPKGDATGPPRGVAYGSRISERQIYQNAMHKLEAMANGQPSTSLMRREARSLLEVIRRHA